MENGPSRPHYYNQPIVGHKAFSYNRGQPLLSIPKNNPKLQVHVKLKKGDIFSGMVLEVQKNMGQEIGTKESTSCWDTISRKMECHKKWVVMVYLASLGYAIMNVY